VLIVAVSCSGGGDFRVVKAVKAPFHIKVHATGQLKSEASTHIGCPVVQGMWQYTISFMAPEGKEVKAGDRILAFDAKKLMEQLQVKKSELETAKKELEKNRLVEQEKLDSMVLQLAESRVQKEKAQRKAEQPENLVSMNEVKKLRMDRELSQLQEKLLQSRIKIQKSGMKTRISELETKIKRLENLVKQQQMGMAKMNVKAPKAGMVVYSSRRRGEKKAVGDNCWIGEKIMELPDLSRMQVAAIIPEPQAGKIKTGLAAEIRLDSNPDKVYNGSVKSLGRIFRTKSWDQPAMVFDAVIGIDDPDPELMRPGMAAGVDIIVASREDVLQIPEDAIIYREEGLFVLKKSFAGKKEVPVSIGVSSGGLVEVLDGLDEGDRVLVRTGGGEKQ
jgi:HlyD family secretion protein